MSATVGASLATYTGVAGGHQGHLAGADEAEDFTRRMVVSFAESAELELTTAADFARVPQGGSVKESLAHARTGADLLEGLYGANFKPATTAVKRIRDAVVILESYTSTPEYRATLAGAVDAGAELVRAFLRVV